ncbi:unnamed protein product [Clonostachys rosea]|uniref:ABC transmembrane type-1 domain-containing protein n=1 Tax=Bionectria ochroleuca TaxID=29856 RepID=A0ABY6TUV3_BIOOC|nr:unnamed protein product [Clonostachys rosea]
MLDGPIYGSIREIDNRRGIAPGEIESGKTEDSSFCRDASSSAWTRNVKDLVKLTRLIKPDGLRRLQIRAISIIVFLLTSTCINFLVPILTARVVNELYSNDTNAPWIGVVILSALSFSGFVISLTCEYLWIPFKCFITETLTRKAYSHFLHLSSDFHNAENISQKTISIRGANVILCHAISQATAGAATVGHLAMLIVFWSQLRTPVRSLSRAVQNTSQGFSQAAAFFRLLHRTPTVYNRQNARPLKRISGKVEFDGVSFAYGEQKTVIENVSFEVAGGETAYVVGNQGSGNLRDKVGILSDTCYILDDTILNNVRYSRVTASDSEVFRACEAAALHEEILRFPQGRYATVVGDNGIKLSVPEMQKIAIAREVLRDPDILVLDNATSALDPSTERTIMASLTKRKRTTFIVQYVDSLAVRFNMRPNYSSRDLSKSLDAHKILVIVDGFET